MARKVSLSEYNRLVRRHNQKIKQHNQKVARDLNKQISNYNQEVKRVNSANKRVVDKYNNQVRKLNGDQRRKKQKYEAALRQLQSTSKTTQIIYGTTDLHSSTTILKNSYNSYKSETTFSNSTQNKLFDPWSEQEVTNSAELLNSLNGYYSSDISSDFLKKSDIEVSLSALSSDLGSRWKGALFSLNHNNPDASRHFCSSIREILTAVINIKAPDESVLISYPNCELHNSRPNRRSKIKYILQGGSFILNTMTNFVDEDVKDVIKLFEKLNSGTHGKAGKLNVQQLIQLKKRVEDTLRFVIKI